MITLLSAGPVLAQDIEEEPQAVVKENVTVVKDGMTTFIIEEERLARVRHILDYLLQNARDHAAMDEFGLAAKELDMAAAYMYMDVQASPENVRKKVEDIAENLHTIADATDQAKTPVNVFDNAIYSAHHTLADYYRQRAETFLAADFNNNAGYALEAALTHYESAAMSWARVHETPVEQVIDQSLKQGLEEFAVAMKSDHPFGKADASGLINRLEQSLDELDTQS